ncbi:MAG: hypothetical protein ACRC6T_05890 [Sarcina sp.]
MKWLGVTSVDELKKLGKMKEVQKNIRVDLDEYFKGKKSKDKNIIEMIKITSNSWEGLLDKIKGFRNLINDLSRETYAIEIDDSVDYFKSEEDRTIFALLELEGRKRNEVLGITRKCFMNEKDAKKWRNEISKRVHPDKSKNKYADRASAKINQLYTEMVGHE